MGVFLILHRFTPRPIFSWYAEALQAELCRHRGYALVILVTATQISDIDSSREKFIWAHCFRGSPISVEALENSQWWELL